MLRNIQHLSSEDFRPKRLVFDNDTPQPIPWPTVFEPPSDIPKTREAIRETRGALVQMRREVEVKDAVTRALVANPDELRAMYAKVAGDSAEIDWNKTNATLDAALPLEGTQKATATEKVRALQRVVFDALGLTDSAAVADGRLGPYTLAALARYAGLPPDELPEVPNADKNKALSTSVEDYKKNYVERSTPRISRPDAFKLSPIADTTKFEQDDWNKYDNPHNKPHPLGAYTHGQLLAYFAAIPGTEPPDGPQLTDSIEDKYEDDRKKLEKESSDVVAVLRNREKVEAEYRTAKGTLETRRRDLESLIAGLDKQIKESTGSTGDLRATRSRLQVELTGVEKELEAIRKNRNELIGDESKQKEDRDNNEKRLNEITAALRVAKAQKETAIEQTQLRLMSVESLDKLINELETKLAAESRIAGLYARVIYPDFPGPNGLPPERIAVAKENVEHLNSEIQRAKEVRAEMGYGVLLESPVTAKAPEGVTKANPYGKPPPVGMFWRPEAEDAYYKAVPGKEPAGGPQLPEGWLEKYNKKKADEVPKVATKANTPETPAPVEKPAKSPAEITYEKALAEYNAAKAAYTTAETAYQNDTKKTQKSLDAVNAAGDREVAAKNALKQAIAQLPPGVSHIEVPA